MPLEGQAIPWDPETMQKRRSSFAPVAAAEGLEVGERKHWYNATPAHEAAEWAVAQGAAAQGTGDEFRRRVYRSYFVHDQNIASPDLLAEIATSLSLDGNDLRQALAEGRHRDEVVAQYDLARRVGVTGVPTFVVNGYALVGAHPISSLQQLIATGSQAAPSEDDESTS